MMLGFMFHSTPRPEAGWWPSILAVIAGIFLPAIAGAAFLYISDAPLSGPPKDGLARTLEEHLLLISAALTAAPLIAWLAAPIAVPLLRLAIRRGWAGVGSAVIIAILVGLPILHIALNGDVTTEDQSVLPHIIAALSVQAVTGWVVLHWAAPGSAAKSSPPINSGAILLVLFTYR